jgi:hypothetical protein
MHEVESSKLAAVDGLDFDEQATIAVAVSQSGAPKRERHGEIRRARMFRLSRYGGRASADGSIPATHYGFAIELAGP